MHRPPVGQVSNLPARSCGAKECGSPAGPVKNLLHVANCSQTWLGYTLRLFGFRARTLKMQPMPSPLVREAELAAAPAEPRAHLPETCLPPWDVAELPEPLALHWRHWTRLIGPAIVMMGIQIGGGEWLL